MLIPVLHHSNSLRLSLRHWQPPCLTVRLWLFGYVCTEVLKFAALKWLGMVGVEFPMRIKRIKATRPSIFGGIGWGPYRGRASRRWRGLVQLYNTMSLGFLGPEPGPGLRRRCRTSTELECQCCPSHMCDIKFLGFKLQMNNAGAGKLNSFKGGVWGVKGGTVSTGSCGHCICQW